MSQVQGDAASSDSDHEEEEELDLPEAEVGTLAALPRHHRKAFAFLKALHDKFPMLVYARTDIGCQSLLRPNSLALNNYFDYHRAKVNKIKSKSKQTDWIRREYTERNFSNPQGLEFRSCYETGNLSLVWFVSTHPTTFYIELSPDTNSAEGSHAVFGTFNFSVAYTTRPTRPITFRLINVSANIKDFKIFSKSRMAGGDWQRTTEARGFDNIKEWIVVSGDPADR